MASYAAITSSPDEHGGSRPHSTSSRSGRSSRHSKLNSGGGSASWLSSVINLVNTIVGAGVLAMPHALSNMGITLGVIVILWAGLTSGFGLYLQTRCARYLDRGGSSFFALSQITYPGAAVVFDAAIMLKCFGVGVSYLIIIGDLMPGVIRGFVGNVNDQLYLVDRQFWVTAFMLVVIPLSFLRKLDSLKYTSMVALVSISYLVVLVVYHFIANDAGHEKGAVHWVRWQGLGSTLSSFPVIVFAYTCHQNMFSILNEIADNSPKRTTAVVTASIGTAASTYILVAVTGYLTFGDNVLGNIVAQYVPNAASTVGRAAIVILVMFSYPLQVHPCRASLDAVLKWRPVNRQAQEFTPVPSSRGSPSRYSLLTGKVPVGRPTPTEMSEVRFAILTTCIIIMSYIVAMTVSSLDKVLAYVGSTGSTAISFILPGLFYYKISAPDSPHHQRLLKDEDEEYDRTASVEEGGSSNGRQAKGELLRKCSLALAIYGFTVMIVCLITNSINIANGR
ncbi:hypothetical protein CBER1_04896 [Cercospora berteroae]|uniref:Amino acid transporter transmembrane domain-containing protein n=1 Tax=Cercospora berteroae TaxID=357750 RepID=A0A2S6BRZ5_9PEZI|nr:hypothetical protein CBER1_04896 [Cercospora berteroae]